jgi:asparagine synthase (glutamine-hydrolysing)
MNDHGDSWPAYTIGYGDSYADDELHDAAETAALLGARHIPVRLDQGEFERSLPRIVECLEEPIAASSIVPMYFVSQRARQDVKVALIGQGPDELFGGYKRHLGVHYGEWWRGLPGGLRSMIGLAVNGLPRSEMLKRGIYSLGVEDRLDRYQEIFSLAPAKTINDLFRDGVFTEKQDNYHLVEYWGELAPQMEHSDELGGFQLLEIRSSLPDELLMYADKLSMAHSLEVRVPYLDRTVVEYVQRLSANFKIRNGTRKWLHRQVCRNYLLPGILRRKKRGFAVNVVDEWFNSSVQSQLPEMLLDRNSLMFELLKPESVRELLEAHRSRRQDNHKLLFSLVMLEQWLRGMRLAIPRVASVA